MQCDSGCQMRARTFYEPLAPSTTRPRRSSRTWPRASRRTPTRREWTIGLRDGVNFSDGTPLNADAVVDNINRARKSFLVGAALEGHHRRRQGRRQDGEDHHSRARWYDFTDYLTGQGFFMASPTWLAAVDADPNKATQPVGTGPFMVDVLQARREPDGQEEPELLARRRGACPTSTRSSSA